MVAHGALVSARRMGVLGKFLRLFLD